MSDSTYKTPFKDRVGVDSLPKKGTSGGKYDSAEGPDLPSRDTSPNGLPELHRDTHFGNPSTLGPYKTPMKDKVG